MSTTSQVAELLRTVRSSGEWKWANNDMVLSNLLKAEQTLSDSLSDFAKDLFTKTLKDLKSKWGDDTFKVDMTKVPGVLNPSIEALKLEGDMLVTMNAAQQRVKK